MDCTRYPLNTNVDSIDMNHMLKNSPGFNDEMLKMIHQLKTVDQLMDERDRVSPDRYGCEKLFVDNFVNAEMGEDFPLIFRDFLYHEVKHISDYEAMSYFDMDDGNDMPKFIFERYAVNVMVNAVNSGSEYTRVLLFHLYKTYYRKEYQSLKRFTSISADEVLSLAQPYGPYRFYLGNVSRILFISRLYGIKMEWDCNALHKLLNDYAKKMNSKPRFTFASEIIDVYDEARKEIEERFDVEKLYRLNDKKAIYLDNVLKWYGYNPAYIDWCDETDDGLEDRLATALAILKKTYPKNTKEYSAEELILYSLILHCVGAAICNQDYLTDTIKVVTYGEEGAGEFYEEFPPMFHPEDVPYDEGTIEKAKQVRPVRDETVREKAQESVYNESRLLEELDELRRKVHMLENDNNSLRADLVIKRKAEEAAKSYKVQMESLNRELAALRSYVYNLTEDDEQFREESVEQMKKELSERRIIIVGGHTNWVSKLKKEFPGWEFISPEAGRSVAVAVVEKADRVYFFTDTISHAQYYQFMNVIKERKVKFSYIHGVNIEKNIRDIYRDMKEE